MGFVFLGYFALFSVLSVHQLYRITRPHCKLHLRLSNNKRNKESEEFFVVPGGCDETAEHLSPFLSPPPLPPLSASLVCVSVRVHAPPGPLEDGLEEEEEECVSEENELLAKDEFSAEENFTAEFEAENMGCEDMEYFCNKGEDLIAPGLNRSSLKASFTDGQFLFLLDNM